VSVYLFVCFSGFWTDFVCPNGCWHDRAHLVFGSGSLVSFGMVSGYFWVGRMHGA
jgi:hypothetical protein